jgi:soluble lytic murein transglycosylase
VQSLMKQESAFKASVLSSSGALGLMQLMPFTALETKDDVVLRTLKEPGPNIEVGTKYLADLLRQYDGNVPYALAAYNAGPHRVAKWRKELKPDATMVDFMEYIPFKETRDYVATILRNRYWYQYRKGLPAQSVFEAWKQAQATPQ